MVDTSNCTYTGGACSSTKAPASADAVLGSPSGKAHLQAAFLGLAAQGARRRRGGGLAPGQYTTCLRKHQELREGENRRLLPESA